jgi:hypothetical protein
MKLVMKKPIRLTLFYLTIGFLVLWIARQGYLQVPEIYVNMLYACRDH